MQVNSAGNQSFSPTGMSENFNKFKQSFDNLDSALESGDLSDAKSAVAQLQQYAPSRSGGRSNPMDEKMQKLASALESGDLSAAQSVYADIKSAMSKRPAGPPPDASDMAGMAEAENSSGLLNTTA